MPSDFVRSYIESALWSSNDGDGVPLDSAKYADAELAPETLKKFEADCEQFQAQYAKLISGLDDSIYRSFPEFHVPHDFWLTRNHHGAGCLGRRLSRAPSDSVDRPGALIR